MSGKPDEMPAGNIVMYWHPIQGELVILLVISCYGNWDELQQDAAHGMSVDFNFFFPFLLGKTMPSVNLQYMMFSQLTF